MSKTTFCQSFPWKRKIQWFDLQGITLLDKTRRASITLATHGISPDYTGFDVRITNKQDGKIASKTFLFKDYLDPRKRADSRSDFQESFKVVDHCGWDWYIAIPRDTAPLVEAIEGYIETWI